MANYYDVGLWPKIDGVAKGFLVGHRQHVYQDFIDFCQGRQDLKILDLGFSMMDLPSMNVLERHYLNRNITASFVEDADPATMARYPDVRFVQLDRNERRLPFADGEFDLVYSQAVIEHVGDREHQVSFLKEMARVGKRIYVTTPSRSFPLETHTFIPFVHYLPRKGYLRIYRCLGFHHPDFTNLRLLSSGEFLRLAKDAGIKSSVVTGVPFFGLPGTLVLKGEAPS